MPLAGVESVSTTSPEMLPVAAGVTAAVGALSLLAVV